MKKLFTWLLVFALCLGILAGCGKKEVEDKGSKKDKSDKETTEETETGEYTLEGVWEIGSDCAYVFGKNGIGLYRYFGMDQYFSYVDNGDSVTVLYEGNFMESVHKYTIEGDVLSIEDSFGDPVEYTRGEDGSITVPEDMELPMPGQQGQQGQEQEQEEELSADYQWWNGQWYGWWCIYDATGAFAVLNNIAWDAYADIQVPEGEAVGHIRIWDSNLREFGTLVNCDVYFEAGWGEHGAMYSQHGNFFDSADWENEGVRPAPVTIEENQWYVDPASSSVSHFANMLEICGEYTDPDNSENTFSYGIYLRPWGTDWSDVANGDTSGCIYDDMMPVYYNEWYVPLVNSYPDNMPSSFKTGIDLLEE